MKKELIIIFLLLLIPLSTAAPQLTIQKDSYQPYETLIGELTGSIISIPEENIKFYEGRREISIEHS